MIVLNATTVLAALALAGILLWGPLGAWVASQKRRALGEGFVLGAVFGPFGVLIEALLPSASATPPKPPTASRPLGGDATPAGADDALYWLVAIGALMLLGAILTVIGLSL